MKYCVIAHFDQTTNIFRSVVCHFDDEVDVGTVLRTDFNNTQQAVRLVSLGNITRLEAGSAEASIKSHGYDWSHVQPKEHDDSFSLLDYCDYIGASKVYIFNGERWSELLLTFSNVPESPLKKKITKDVSAI
ncbi:hypothetical protein TDB9533_00662 [Thalassocella blandensis]|nr:hypothetical protein TDB9533_00662 [Thalassocella blandensis]